MVPSEFTQIRDSTFEVLQGEKQDFINGHGFTRGGSRKTKMCKHYEKGSCDKGDGCNFAHSQHELVEYAPSLSQTSSTSTSVNNSQSEMVPSEFTQNRASTFEVLQGEEQDFIDGYGFRREGNNRKTKMCVQM